MSLLRISAAFAVVASLSGLAAACSKVDSESPESACNAWASASLDYYARCGVPFSESTLAAEKARLTTACVKQQALPGSGFTTAFLEGCATATRGAACRISILPACDPVGTLADGAACVSDEQCKSTVCKRMLSTDACGTCATFAPLGSACTKDSECAVDAYCDRTTMKCAARVISGVGGPCDNSKGQRCDESGYCDDANVCRPRAQVGESCLSAQCAGDLRCDSTRKCVAVKTVGEGEACDGELLQCGPTYRCAAGKCRKVVLAKPGEDCSAEGQCERGECDWSGTRKCPTVIPDGGACSIGSATTMCDYFAACKDGKCTMVGDLVCK